VQDRSVLRAGQSGRDVDDPAAQRRSARSGMAFSGEDAGGAQQVVAIAAHRIQAAFAPKRPDGMCANGPSIRSANTVSMIACCGE
jgi:hypothetical protein